MSKSSSSKFKSTSVIIEYSDSDSDDVIVNGIESLDIGDIIEKIKPNEKGEPKTKGENKKEEKRRLTEEEMYDVTDFLEVDPEKDWETSMEVLSVTRQELFLQLKDVEIYPSKIIDLKKGLIHDYNTSKLEPGTAVGCDASLAIGEPTTQLTLNSIDYKEHIIIKNGKFVSSPKIGDLIDKIMADNKKDIVLYEEVTEYVDINFMNLETQCVDEHGKMSWKKIEAVTRHPPPDGNKLLDVTTQSGRRTTATKAKSFLLRRDNKIVGVNGSELKVGDRLPVTVKFPRPSIEERSTSVDLSRYTTRSSLEMNLIPQEYELDNDFGFIVGAYITGHCENTGTQCIISNNDQSFRDRLEKWCKRHNIRFDIRVQNDKHFKGDTGTDFLIHSPLMCEWFTNMCGNYSHGKHIPDFTMFACDEFIKGMMDGYFSGDGKVDKRGNIMCSSVSERLIDELMMVLNMYDIFSYKSVNIATKNNENENILPLYNLEIRSGNAGRYYENFNFTIGYKQERLNLNKGKKYEYKYNINDLIPGIKSEQVNGTIRREELEKILLDEKILEEGVSDEDIGILNEAFESEVSFDKIISIVEIDSTTPLVYDLTVFETRNFTLRNGLSIRDTFHLAGVSSANVTLGVPRANELLNASKNQKTNILKIALLPESVDLKSLQSVKDKCRSTFEEKYVDQCITKHEIFERKYDNLSLDDQIWYPLFDMFHSTRYKECNWCVRLIFDKYVLYQYKLSTEKIANMIETEYKDCRCVFSPDEYAIVDVYIDTANVDTPSVILATKKKTSGRKRTEDFKKDPDVKEKEPRVLITDENKDYYFVARVALDYILGVKLTGIEGIMKIYYQLDNKTKNWCVESSGTNMRDIMNHPDVDFKNVFSNNMWEIFGILGIEAVRRFLISEITSVVSFGGTFIDPAHPCLLADSMTSTGTITSVNRYGISKSVVGVLTPASFEQSHQNMLDAPAKGVTDDLSTVSADIIVAKHIKIGTGYFSLYTDTKKLKTISIPKSLPLIMEEVNNLPVDTRFPTSNAVFKNGGVGKVFEKVFEKNNENDKPEYIDF